jgi:trk system potassium uptake protein TrkH
VVAAVATWIAGAWLAAVPLYLSGHYASWLDAVFDGLSGLTTTGLSVIQDLDHLPGSLVVYRQSLELVGGVAIVMVGLALLNATTATASSLRPGDVRDERILPNTRRTWHRAWRIAAGIVGSGALACTVAVAGAGIAGGRAILHGLSLAISAATTGGFAPTSLSVRYYHSATLEFVLIGLMLAGAISFAIHVAAGHGGRLRLLREFELRVMAVTMIALVGATVLGLARAGTYTDAWPLFRHGVFMTVAAHTTTGLETTAAGVVGADWGALAPASLVAAMTLGGMTGSTAGGLKAVRVGIVFRGVVMQVRRVLLPDAAYLATSFTLGRPKILTDAHVRSAATVLLLMLTTTLTAAVAWLFVDGTVPLTEALFVATSAATNSGLSLQATVAGSPTTVKLGLMLLMLLGRLEWMAVFAAAGFVYAGLRGRR